MWTTYFSVRVFVFNAKESLSHSRSLEFCHLHVAHYSSEEIRLWAYEIQYAELFTPSTKYIKVTDSKWENQGGPRKFRKSLEGHSIFFFFLCEIKSDAFFPCFLCLILNYVHQPNILGIGSIGFNT